MTGLTAAEASKALRHVADRIEADPLIPPLSPHWPLTFRVPGVATTGQLEAIGRSLGVEDAQVTPFIEEEDGQHWHRLRGRVAGFMVEVTADAGPILLDSLRDEGGIRRTYVGVTA